ncbi:alpha/beta hydrolase [Hyalangium rubrum]|uniref:Alpha/beta hydrolase n=1 Tax=Hyalangium rubrum TaxID=3103134 RepID=A0ABU5HF00_9BACT|nr:alpha/beta hydrolase [Hyalangium sp. s54d21]MDY7231826.1 alpha/beta hydrolase [Hyalangium sp. s54d21]
MPEVEEALRCGTFHVPENRQTGQGRTLPLRVIVIPARAERPGEPVFFLSGGPGQAATESAQWMVKSWERENHDVVLVDMRGTGEGHRLDCRLGGSDDDPQAYLDPIFFEGTLFRSCREELEKQADLTQYTTPIAMQDLDALRQALGYDKIHLEGGSYGTRAGLTYLHMYGQHVRSALLTGLVPVSNRSPLFHAAAAQRAFEQLLKECAAEAPCHAAYPNPREDLAAILQSLREKPARVRVPHPVTQAPTELLLSEPGFTDGLRVMLYSAEAGRRVPLLLQRARAGEFTPFAEAALQSSRGVKTSLRLGLLLSVTCSEDVTRIRPEEIDRETAGSFIGSHRVRGQMAACAEWPKAQVPEDYFRPFSSEVPVLLISGNLDPVTPPHWAEEARRSLPNSIHVVTPGAHTASNDCIESLGRKLFRTSTIRGLDTRCVEAIRNPAFTLPTDSAAKSAP